MVKNWLTKTNDHTLYTGSVARTSNLRSGERNLFGSDDWKLDFGQTSGNPNKSIYVVDGRDFPDSCPEMWQKLSRFRRVAQWI
jgi:hypothetical protein